MEPKRPSNKAKATKFPETPFAFYIKLYCKQKRSSQTKYQNNLIEATKSWLSLTEEEKQQVHESYKEQEHKFKIQCFEKLKNAEAYMKVKDPIGLQNVDLNISSSVIQKPEVSMTEVSLQTDTEEVNQLVNDEDMNLSYDGELGTVIEPDHGQEEHNETKTEPEEERDETPRTILVEPMPPTIKTAKELFCMLTPAGGAEESVSWPALPTTEKSQYRRAVSLLKSDYITKYKEYLETLTPKELFDHYNKTLFFKEKSGKYISVTYN